LSLTKDVFTAALASFLPQQNGLLRLLGRNRTTLTGVPIYRFFFKETNQMLNFKHSLL